MVEKAYTDPPLGLIYPVLLSLPYPFPKTPHPRTLSTPVLVHGPVQSWLAPLLDGMLVGTALMSSHKCVLNPLILQLPLGKTNFFYGR